MGLIHKENQALKEIKKQKIQEYLKEIDEVSKKHNLTLVPAIGRYGATFEVQEIPKQEFLKPDGTILEPDKK